MTAPTDERRARAGRFWSRASALQCQVLVWLAYQYSPEGCEKFILLKWEELGRNLQDDITVALEAWLELAAKTARA